MSNIIEVLTEARNQLAYLNEKFPETGTTNSMLTRIDSLLQKGVGEFSDGYHTFNELYDFRKMYNAVLFNEWANQKVGKLGDDIMHFTAKHDVHKSWRHHDGELCFGGGWFIVVAILPTGQISNHYEAKDWDLFQIPEVEKAKYPFDFHTAKDVLERLSQTIKK